MEVLPYLTKRSICIFIPYCTCNISLSCHNTVCSNSGYKKCTKNAKKYTKLSPAGLYALGSTLLKSHTTRKADKINSSLAIHSVNVQGLSFSLFPPLMRLLNFSWIAFIHCWDVDVWKAAWSHTNSSANFGIGESLNSLGSFSHMKSVRSGPPSGK